MGLAQDTRSGLQSAPGVPGSGAGVQPFSCGAPRIGEFLSGGLARGALHEIYAPAVADVAAASGFAVALAYRAAGGRPVAWVRQDFADVETGRPYGPGLVELGLDPHRLLLVQARDAAGVLRAGAEAIRCPALGAVLMEPWGEPKALDLTATRRLSLAPAGRASPFSWFASRRGRCRARP
ncbi:MAG TPA: hypothetical protein VGC80_03550 [Acetobacteraceae bacterium]